MARPSPTEPLSRPAATKAPPRGGAFAFLRQARARYLLWMILGYLVVTSVLIVSLGRLGDMYGRVRIFNAGFAVYTVASLMLTVCWLKGSAGADFLIGFRVVRGSEARACWPTRRRSSPTRSRPASAAWRWVQGIWLPQHGYDFTETPLWAGIYMSARKGRPEDGHVPRRVRHEPGRDAR